MKGYAVLITKLLVASLKYLKLIQDLEEVWETISSHSWIVWNLQPNILYLPGLLYIRGMTGQAFDKPGKIIIVIIGLACMVEHH